MASSDPTAYECDTVRAVEDAWGRASVFAFAANEYESRLQTYDSLRQRAHEGDPLVAGLVPRMPPSYEDCVALSRRLRIKRERDATYRSTTVKNITFTD